MTRRAIVLWSLLLPALQGAQAATYADALPSEDEAKAAIASSPAIEVAREERAIAGERRRQLEAGQYEWAVGLSEQRRKDALGTSFSEQTYEISRGVRLFGKARLDRSLGAQVASVGEYGFADAWHEAGRALLGDWFDWLRAKRRAGIVGAQAGLLEQQLERTRARQRAGDAPRLEVLLAQAELDRAAAAVTAAEQQVEERALRIGKRFPGLALHEPATLGEPENIAGQEDRWVERILADNHEIELAEGIQEQARLAAERARRDRLPDPTVSLRYSNNLDGNDRLVGLNVVVPLGGERRRAEASIARAQANIAAGRARETRLEVEAEARRAVLAARSTYSQWVQLRDVADKSEANATAVARGYSLGEYTITEALAARRQSLESALAAATAQLDAVEAIARLRLDTHQLWSLEPMSPSP